MDIFNNSLIVIFCIIFMVNTCEATLKNLTLTIEPPWVHRGHSVQLYCNYDTNISLYTVKWYRGTLEFYRFSPFEKIPAQIFSYDGIKVDPLESNNTHVTLRNVGFNLSGNFSCEVTADAPSFSTETVVNFLTVVDIPHSSPVLDTDKDKYDPGDILQATCTLPPSRPVANITFEINSNVVPSDPIVYTSHHDLHLATRNLTILIQPSHYQNGQLRLRCIAEIGAFYFNSTERPLWSSRTEPIPERDAFILFYE